MRHKKLLNPETLGGGFFILKFCCQEVLVIDEELKVDQTHSLFALVDDSLEPGLALDVKELTLGNVGKLDGDGRADQVGLDLMREESHGNTLVGRVVGDGGDGFFVGRVLSVALDVDAAGLVDVQDAILDGLRDIGGEVLLIGRVGLGHESEDLVELDDDARLHAGVLAVAVGKLSASSEGAGIELAGRLGLLAGLVQFISRAFDGTLLSLNQSSVQEVGHPGGESGVRVLLEVEGLLSVPVALEVVHGRIDASVGLSRPDSHAGIDANDALLLHPLGSLVVQRQEEDLKHAVPKSGQTGVVDDVEEEDEEPRFRGPGAEGSGVGVVDEVADSLPAVTFDRLDGSASQQLGHVGVVSRHTLASCSHDCKVELKEKKFQKNKSLDGKCVTSSEE